MLVVILISSSSTAVLLAMFESVWCIVEVWLSFPSSTGWTVVNVLHQLEKAPLACDNAPPNKINTF